MCDLQGKREESCWYDQINAWLNRGKNTPETLDQMCDLQGEKKAAGDYTNKNLDSTEARKHQKHCNNKVQKWQQKEIQIFIFQKKKMVRPQL